MESLEISKNNVLLFCNKEIYNRIGVMRNRTKHLARTLPLPGSENPYLNRRASSIPGSSARINASRGGNLLARVIDIGRRHADLFPSPIAAYDWSAQ